MAEVIIKDCGNKRAVEIKGRHFSYNGWLNESKFDSFYSEELLRKILDVLGEDHIKDDIDRVENKEYIEVPLKKFLEQFSIDIRDKNILDFGCGSGAASVILAKFGAKKILGVDIDAGRLDIAKLRIRDYGFNDRIEVCLLKDTKSLPFKNNSFDIVICNAVIEHIDPKERKFYIKELWRLVSPGGYFLILETPNRLWPKETHTTNLWFISWLPLRLAKYYASFSDSISCKESLEELIAKGFRGATYWQIVNPIQDKTLIEMNKIISASIEEIFPMTRSQSQNRLLRIIKGIMRFFFKLTQKVFLKPFNLPVCAFLSFLNICLKKKKL